jgi:DNA-binding response OmpR family regulator
MSNEKLSILLADDEETFVKVLALHLREHYNYQTTVVFSGKEAIEQIENSREGFDVVLLDYMMPEVNGLNVLQWMLEQKNQTPVIMLTAAGSEQVAVEALKLGAFDYVRKELLEFDHLDILIRGTHERHLFRKEREQKVQLLRDREHDRNSLENFQNSINSLSHVVNNSIALLSLNIKENQHALSPYVKEEARQQFATAFEEIDREYKTISSVVNLIQSLSRAMQETLSGSKPAPPDASFLQKEIETILRNHKEKMDS